jgi:hypothetical protein
MVEHMRSNHFLEQRRRIVITSAPTLIHNKTTKCQQNNKGEEVKGK